MQPENPESPETQLQEVETEQTEQTEGTEEKLSSKFQLLTRKAKRLQEQEAAIKQDLAMVEEFKNKESAWKENPLQYVKDAGLTYEDLVDAVLSEHKPQETDEVQELKKRIEAFEEEAKQKKIDEELAQKQQQANQYVQTLRSNIDGAEGEYELLKATENYQLVVDTIVEHYNNTQEEMPWNEAATMVEDFLESDLTTNLAKLIKIKKIQSKLGITTPKSPDEILQSALERHRPAEKTITNRKASEQPSQVDVNALTEDQRRERAIAMLKKLGRE